VPVFVVVDVNCAEHAPWHEYYDGRKQQNRVFIVQIKCQQDEQYYKGGDVQKAFPDEHVPSFEGFAFLGNVVVDDCRLLGLAIGQDFPAIDALVIAEAILRAAFITKNTFVVLSFRNHDDYILI